MMQIANSWRRRIGAGAVLAGLLLAANALSAQNLRARIRAEVSNAEMTPIKGSLHPFVRSGVDAGSMPADTRLVGMALSFKRSDAQETDLQTLLAAQQNPASPQYHQWLTPDQFAARFGMAQADIDKVTLWLQQQGFSVESVARSRNMIRFSGTVNQVNLAFRTQMHYFTTNGEKHFSPNSELSVPSAIAPVVQSVTNLSDFRPRSMRVPRPSPTFTSSISGSVFFSPGDIKVAYDVTPLVTGNIDGTGQEIAIVGQSAVSVTDVEKFQSAAGMTVKDPTMVLVPGTGTSTAYSGDQSESDLDLEWSNAMAPGANIYFVYTGSSSNASVFDSIIYAIDQKIGSIISISYGSCETAMSSQALSTMESAFAQAAVQGQTVLVASGDSGSSGCYGLSGLSTTQQQVLDVSYPASSPNVTAVGGTEIDQSSAAYYTSTGAYWSTKGSADTITSALQYLPEVAWNDEVYIKNNGGSGLSATGGGISGQFAKPSWQTGVSGISSAGRNVPDVSLYSSPIFAGYLYCTSDQSAWGTSQTGSCGSGFRATSSDTTLTVAGGTSFATPILAGMLALINQKQGYVNGQGLINPTFYTLASNSTTYSTVFHDITSGNNECLAGSVFCSSTSGTTTHYTTTAGYDAVTGLGSFDLGLLATAWPANSGSSAGLVDTTTTVSASNTAPDVSASVTFTVTVAPTTGTATPTGNVTLQIDGGTSGGGTTLANQALSSNGTLTYATSFATAGTHQVIAQYAGTGTFAASVGVGQVAVGGTSSGTGSFTLSATNLTLSRGNSGSSTITVTPAGGFTGTVTISPTGSDKNVTVCYTSAATTVSGTAAATGSLVIDTNLIDCGAGSVVKSPGAMKRFSGSNVAKNNPAGSFPAAPLALSLAGVFVGLLGLKRRKLRWLAMVIVLGSISFGVTACGGGGSSSSGSYTAKGTYVITVTGVDTSSTKTATTTFTLTVN
ncbi:MAG TPA: protease pro-enzyme activation domain-containing protein [Terracidiphilus sp.]